MGVEQLFPQLKAAWRAVNLQESARGESVGIDAVYSARGVRRAGSFTRNILSRRRSKLPSHIRHLAHWYIEDILILSYE